MPSCITVCSFLPFVDLFCTALLVLPVPVELAEEVVPRKLHIVAIIFQRQRCSTTENSIVITTNSSSWLCITRTHIPERRSAQPMGIAATKRVLAKVWCARTRNANRSYASLVEDAATCHGTVPSGKSPNATAASAEQDDGGDVKSLVVGVVGDADPASVLFCGVLIAGL